jgi:hypothetical protein
VEVHTESGVIMPKMQVFTSQNLQAFVHGL